MRIALLATYDGPVWIRFVDWGEDEGQISGVIAWVTWPQPKSRRGRHRTRWRTPWQHMLGELALVSGIKGTRHAA
jgi:hypothetical protein